MWPYINKLDNNGVCDLHIVSHDNVSGKNYSSYSRTISNGFPIAVT